MTLMHLKTSSRGQVIKPTPLMGLHDRLLKKSLATQDVLLRGEWQVSIKKLTTENECETQDSLYMRAFKYTK